MARKILLVDSDAGFLQTTTDVLARSAFTVETASDGARALEAALAGKPDLVITNYHLPIFSGERLRSFLRNNPTTFHIPFIFLVDEERARDASLASLGKDGVLVKPVGREELLRRIGEAFGADKIERRSVQRGESGVEGNLKDVSLVDLTQIFSLNRRTGILAVSRGGTEGQVYFRNGEVVSCQLGSARGEKAFFRMLHWKDGSFRYSPNDYTVSRDISRSSDALLMEGLRQLDEWAGLAGKMPSDGSLLTLAKNPDDLPNELRPVTQEVLLLLEFYNRVGEIVDKCSYTDYEICRTIIALIQKGIIEVATGPGSPGRPGGPLLSTETAVQVCALLGRDERSQLGYGTGRVLVFADPPELVRDFLARASEIPEFSLSRDNFSNQEVLAFSFGTLGNLVIGETAQIALFLLPCRKDALPAWKPFSEGAMGAILLTRDGAEGESATLARRFVAGGLGLPMLTAAAGPDGMFHPSDVLSRFFALLLAERASAADPVSVG
jgi:CheY-like chemotaxis protein